MTRHVVTNSQVPHLWAHQAQLWAKGGGSISFEGKILKSYWLTIGNIIADKDGANVALILDSYSSVTTSHHLSMASSAVRGVMPSYRVPYVDAEASHGPTSLQDQHKLNVEWLLKNYRDMLAKGMRGSADNREYRLRDAQGSIEIAREYAARFAVEGIDWPDRSADLATYQAHWDRRLAKLNDPKHAEKRANANHAKQERDRRHYREGTGAYAFDQRMGYSQQERLDQFITVEDREARQASFARVNADRIAAWRNGQLHDLPYGLQYDGSALLRLSSDRKTIETSQGAVFPVEHGKLAFRLIAKVRESGEAWRTNGHTLHLGPYRVDEISPEGNVRAGCHRVAWVEIERIARQLGLLPCPGAEACP